MEISNEFKSIIDADIEKCKNTAKSASPQELYSTYMTIKSKYTELIDGFSSGLFDVFYDESGTGKRKNLELFEQKLSMFKAMGYKNLYAKNEGTSVTLSNSNQMNTNINVSFETARDKIENMSALKEEEIEEILSQIKRIEEIVSSSDRRAKKWDNAKDIIKWIADKGADVGIALLPLLLKIGQ